MNLLITNDILKNYFVNHLGVNIENLNDNLNPVVEKLEIPYFLILLFEEISKQPQWHKSHRDITNRIIVKLEEKAFKGQLSLENARRVDQVARLFEATDLEIVKVEFWFDKVSKEELTIDLFPPKETLLSENFSIEESPKKEKVDDLQPIVERMVALDEIKPVVEEHHFSMSKLLVVNALEQFRLALSSPCKESRNIISLPTEDEVIMRIAKGYIQSEVFEVPPEIDADYILQLLLLADRNNFSDLISCIIFSFPNIVLEHAYHFERTELRDLCLKCYHAISHNVNLLPTA